MCTRGRDRGHLSVCTRGGCGGHLSVCTRGRDRGHLSVCTRGGCGGHLSVCTRGGDGGVWWRWGRPSLLTASDFAENEDTQATSGPKMQSSAQPGLTPDARETLRQARWRLLTPRLRPWLPEGGHPYCERWLPLQEAQGCLYSGTFSPSQQEQCWDHQVLESQAGCTGP